MKALKLLLIFFGLLVFINQVNAITVYGEWQNNQDNIIINDNEEAYFDYALFSMNTPISYSIKMYDIDTNLIKTFAQGNSNNNMVSNREYARKSDYLNSGDYTIVIQGSDSLNSESKTLRLKVNNIQVNHAPILNQISDKIVDEGELLEFTITATDQDNNKIYLGIENLPGNAQFIDNEDGTGLFLWQTNFNDYGNYDLRFTASDGKLNDVKNVKIQVNNVNQNPVLNIISPKGNEIVSGIYKIKWNAYDNDQNTNTLDIKIEYSYNGYNFMVLEDLNDNNDGEFIWDTTILSNADDYKLKITARDDEGISVNKVVNFEIDNNVNPNINIISPRENEIISGNYNILWDAYDSGQDSNTLDIKMEYRLIPPKTIFNYIISLFNNGWVILEDLENNNDGIFVWDTLNLRNGEYQLRIIAKDDERNIATGFVNSFFINNIRPQINHNPVITSNPILNAKINQLYGYDVNAFDQDNDVLSYVLKIYPSGMNIKNNNGLISWIPKKEGNYNVVVRVFDGKGGIAQQSFTINVAGELIIEEENEDHEFSIENVILKQNKNDLNLFVNIKNKGDKEEVKLIARDIINGKYSEESFNLNVNEGTWKIMTLKNIDKGRHVIKVEAISKAFKDIHYGYVYIN